MSDLGSALAKEIRLAARQAVQSLGEQSRKATAEQQRELAKVQAMLKKQEAEVQALEQKAQAIAAKRPPQ